MTALRYADR